MQRPFLPSSALLLVGVQLLAALGVLLLGALVSGGERAGAVFLGAIPVVAPLVAIYVGLVRYAPDQSTSAALRLGRPAGAAWLHVALALLLGVALAPGVAFLQEQLLALFPAEPLSPELENELREAMEQPTTVAFLALVQVLLAPLAHEALYRGLMQPRLIGVLGTRRGVILASIFFAAAQLTPGLLPVALVVGLALGVVALASGTTWAPLAAHVAAGATPYAAAGLGHGFVDAETGATTLPIWLVVASTALAAALLATIWRVRRR